MRKLLAVMVLGALAWTWRHEHATPVPPDGEPSVPSVRSSIPAPEARFACDGRQYCSQMTSCEEATYFLQHCPDPKMDGDHDGIPCERQWC